MTQFLSVYSGYECLQRSVMAVHGNEKLQGTFVLALEPLNFHQRKSFKANLSSVPFQTFILENNGNSK